MFLIKSTLHHREPISLFFLTRKAWFIQFHLNQLLQEDEHLRVLLPTIPAFRESFCSNEPAYVLLCSHPSKTCLQEKDKQCLESLIMSSTKVPKLVHSNSPYYRWVISLLQSLLRTIRLKSASSKIFRACLTAKGSTTSKSKLPSMHKYVAPITSLKWSLMIPPQQHQSSP